MTKYISRFFAIVCILLFACTLTLHADDKTARQDKINKEMDKFGIKPKEDGSGAKEPAKDSGAKKDDGAKPAEKPEMTNGSATNNGKDAVNVQPHNIDGKTGPATPLKPGESMSFPPGTVGVIVRNPGGKDGIHVTVTHPNGDKTGINTKENSFLGDVHKPNVVDNKGQGSVIIKGKTESGGISVTQLGPGKHMELPAGTKEVRVEKDPAGIGNDKDPDVDVTGPDGSKQHHGEWRKWKKVEGKNEKNDSTSQNPDERFDVPGSELASNPVRGAEIEEGRALEEAHHPDAQHHGHYQ